MPPELILHPTNEIPLKVLNQILKSLSEQAARLAVALLARRTRNSNV